MIRSLAIRPAHALLIGALAATSLTGCGALLDSDSSPKADGTSAEAGATAEDEKDASPKEIIEGMNASIESAKSLTISMNITLMGVKVDATTSGFRDSSDGRMTYVTETGARSEVLLVGDKTFVKSDLAYWKSPLGGSLDEATAQVVADKYVSIPLADAKDLRQDGVIDVIKSMKMDDPGYLSNVFQKAETVDVEGKTYYKLTDRLSDDQYLLITTDGAFQLYQAHLKDSPDEASTDLVAFTMSDWNAVPAVTEPPADQIADLKG